jgi:ABC-type sugar transport system substrate-binding protein
MTCGSEQGSFPTVAYCALEAEPMKVLTATALLLALSAVAFAKPNLVDRPRVAFVYADINMGWVGAMHENIGSVGAMRERDYFGAPHSPSDFPCRLEPVLFQKTRLSQSCR